MIQILYDNKPIRNCSNMSEAINSCKSYIQLMIDGKLAIKEIVIDINNTNPQTLKRTHRRIIIKESLPQTIIAQQTEIPQNELGLTNRVE